MLPDLSQTSMDSIINDDSQHINTQITEVEKERSHLLTCILLLQGIWIFLLTFFLGATSDIGMSTIPTFLAVVLMMFDFGIKKVQLQKIAKCFFFYTLLRSLGWTLVFVYVFLQFIGIAGGKLAGDWILVIINMFVECLTAACTLQVLRLTNQYFVLINRKMSRGVTEDDLKYNC